MISSIVNNKTIIWEWGTGSSTLWLARKANSVYTVDSSIKWKKKIKKWSSLYNLKNIHFLLFDLDNPLYCDAILSSEYQPDLIIIDGKKRVECFNRAISKLKPSGFIMVDDIERCCYKPILQTANISIVQETKPDISGKKAALFGKQKLNQKRLL
ncbi:MAG: hypothetical protein ABIJ84_04255 [bacterium]